jgi:hypothetical protein
MLWQKAWLETRVRLLFGLCIYAAMFIGMSFLKPPPSAPLAAIQPSEQVKAIVGYGFATCAVAITAVMLAGAGIATQSAFQQTKGLHGSTLFTLSLPVSRLRLLSIRAGLGWLELAGFAFAFCAGMWAALAPLRATVLPGEMFRYAVTLVVCSAGLYSISVLLATFLDDIWRISGSMAVFGALWWIFNHAPPLASVNIFRAMGEGSPLVAHAMPWAAMAFSLCLGAILFFAALKVVQAREY